MRRLVLSCAIALSLATPGTAVAGDSPERAYRDAERAAERQARDAQRAAERQARDALRAGNDVTVISNGPTTFEETRVDYNTANNDLIVSTGNTTVRDTYRGDSRGNMIYVASSRTETQGVGNDTGMTYHISNSTRDMFTYVATPSGNTFSLQAQRERRTLMPVDGPISAEQTITAGRFELQRNGETILSRTGQHTTCGRLPCDAPA